MKVSVAIPHVTSKLGEGPHWGGGHTDTVVCGQLGAKGFQMEYYYKGARLRPARYNQTVGSVVPCRNGGYLVGMGRTISHLEWNTGVTTKLHEVDSVGFDDRFNDGKCDPAGRFWTGTMGGQIDNMPTYDKNVGSLYCLDTNGTLVKHFNNITVSNGLAWSSDKQVMYYIDTPTRKVEAFTYHVTSGKISNRRDAIDFHSFPEESTMGWPDGMTIDTDGHLWVACYGAGKVICFDPVTGKTLKEVIIPAPRTTSCCFGGKNLDELYVTTWPNGAFDQELRYFPLYGSVFKVTGLGVKGVPANVYERDVDSRL